MIVNRLFLKRGEPTTCADLDFMARVADTLPLFSYTPPQALQARMIAQWESDSRYEYTVRDDAGILQALMIIKSEFDIQLGLQVLVIEFACSLQPGLLNPAYRWAFGDLAKHHGLTVIRYSVTKSDGFYNKYKGLEKIK